MRQKFCALLVFWLAVLLLTGCLPVSTPTPGPPGETPVVPRGELLSNTFFTAPGDWRQCDNGNPLCTVFTNWWAENMDQPMGYIEDWFDIGWSGNAFIVAEPKVKGLNAFGIWAEYCYVWSGDTAQEVKTENDVSYTRLQQSGVWVNAGMPVELTAALNPFVMVVDETEFEQQAYALTVEDDELARFWLGSGTEPALNELLGAVTDVDETNTPYWHDVVRFRFVVLPIEPGQEMLWASEWFNGSHVQAVTGRPSWYMAPGEYLTVSATYTPEASEWVTVGVEIANKWPMPLVSFWFHMISAIEH